MVTGSEQASDARPFLARVALVVLILAVATTALSYEILADVSAGRASRCPGAGSVPEHAGSPSCASPTRSPIPRPEHR